MMKEFRYKTIDVKLFVSLFIPFTSIILICSMSLAMTFFQNYVWLVLIFCLIILVLPFVLSIEEIKVEIAEDKVRIKKTKLILKPIKSIYKEISLSDIMLIKLTAVPSNNKYDRRSYFYLSIYTKGKRKADVILTPPLNVTTALADAGYESMNNVLSALLDSGSYVLSKRFGYAEYTNTNMLESEASTIAYLKSKWRGPVRTIILIIGLLAIFVLCLLFTMYLLLPLISI